MKYILESEAVYTRFQSRNAMKGLPFYGQKGDFNFVSGRSQFTPGISIKLVPLKDLSRKSDPGFSDFDMQVNHIKKFFKKGDKVRGILINSKGNKENGKIVVGRLHKIKFDYPTKSIKIFIRNPLTNKIQEIYFSNQFKLSIYFKP